MRYALGIDIGGTKIFSAVIDANGNIVSDVEKFSTPVTYDEIKSLFSEIIQRHEKEVDIVAFSTCGAVNNTNDAILGSTGNIVSDYPKMPFESLSSKPVFVENDANCAAYAEYKVGASKGCLNSVMLTLGTGVGGGIIVNGKLLKGQNGAAGEMHFKMRMDKHRKCTCGSWDCFEIYASGKGLKITGEEISNNPNITTYDIIGGVKGNDPLMKKIYDQWISDITCGIIGLANIFDPECVVLSGSMAEFVNTEIIEYNVNKEIVTTPVEVKKACAGNYSGMIGAALLAFDSEGANG